MATHTTVLPRSWASLLKPKASPLVPTMATPRQAAPLPSPQKAANVQAQSPTIGASIVNADDETSSDQSSSDYCLDSVKFPPLDSNRDALSATTLSSDTCKSTIRSATSEDLPTHIVVDSLELLHDMLKQIKAMPSRQPLFIDLEGRHLGRHGHLSVLTIYLQHPGIVFLVDITSLDQDVFDAKPETAVSSLREIFQSKTVDKVFFDARSPSDAMFAIYGVGLEAVQEVQLMELRGRNSSKRFVRGLSKCIEDSVGLDEQQKASWLAIRKTHRCLCNPAYGGDDGVLDQRPLHKDVLQSCISNASGLALLWEMYKQKQSGTDTAVIRLATSRRIAFTQTPSYIGQGRHMARGPW